MKGVLGMSTVKREQPKKAHGKGKAPVIIPRDVQNWIRESSRYEGFYAPDGYKRRGQY